MLETLNKKVVAKLSVKPLYDIRDSERLMKEWIKEYLAELKSIDEFYSSKLKEQIKKFIEL